MTPLTIKTLLASIALAVSLPAFADRDDHDRRHHRGHGYEHSYYRDDACRYKSWYDRDGHYHERRVCRDARYPAPRPVVMMPPQAIVLQPPSVYIQPPGIFIR